MISRDTFIEVDDKQLFARIWQPASTADEKSPIILFHDSLGSVELWRNFPATLCEATGRKIIAYDRLGYGKSSPKTIPQELDFVTHEAETYFPALREHLEIDKFIAFGHSVGGGMAVYCAAKFHNDCEALITEAAQAFVEERTLEGIREAQIMFADPANVQRLAKYHGNKTRWVLDAWIDTWLSEEFSDWHLKEILPQVKCPVLAIHGSDDEYGSIKHPQIIHKLSGGDSRMEILEGLKHVPHREDGQAVIDLVVAFLAQHA